jgi:CRISPR/Cas system-associated protein Cas7 (RAMP superfamily)
VTEYMIYAKITAMATYRFSFGMIVLCGSNRAFKITLRNIKRENRINSSLTVMLNVDLLKVILNCS